MASTVASMLLASLCAGMSATIRMSSTPEDVVI
jgi:hypothetical protein